MTTMHYTRDWQVGKRIQPVECGVGTAHEFETTPFRRSVTCGGCKAMVLLDALEEQAERRERPNQPGASR